MPWQLSKVKLMDGVIASTLLPDRCWRRDGRWRMGRWGHGPMAVSGVGAAWVQALACQARGAIEKFQLGA